LGGAERFADYSQWDAWQRLQLAKKSGLHADSATGGKARGVNSSDAAGGGVKLGAHAASASVDAQTTSAKKKLSYQEAREFAAMEHKIAEAEKELHARQATLHDPAIISDGPKLHRASVQLNEAQNTVDTLYARWAELEQKRE
jgi:ATP-binding cassette subfamily F protein uup